MLELDLLTEKSGLEMIATRAAEIAQTSYRDATEYLINSIGVRPTRTKNEAYYAEAFAYLRGVTLAHANMPAESAEAIEASHVLPHGGGRFLFDEAVRQSLAIAAAQDDAIARRVPAFAIASMPRAASAAFTQTLAALMNAPTMRISLGKFPHFIIAPSWARRFIRGGAILHDHFGATAFNLAALRECGIERVHVIVRDPRSAAASLVRFSGHPSGDPLREGKLAAVFTNSYIPWLEGWVQAEAEKLLSIRWIRKMDFTKSAAALSVALSDIIDSSGGRPDLPHGARGAALSDANRLVGDDDAWRAMASPDLQQQMWSQIPSKIKDLLDLKP
jgi:hypothetical protein